MTNTSIKRKIIKIASMLFFTGQLASLAAQGLPGDNVITQRWRELFSKYSPLSNSSFLTEENYVAVRGAFMPSLQANDAVWEGGVTVPVGLYQSLGLTWVGQSAPSITKQDINNPADTSLLVFQNNFIMGTYAINPWKALSLGVNANLAMQNAFGEQRMGYGLDFGVSYRILKNALIGNHLLGVNAQNIVAPTLTATNGTETFSKNLRITLYSTYWEKTIESNFDFCMKDFMAQSSEFSAGTISNWEFTGRLGVSLLQTLKVSGLFGMNPNGLKYVGLAVSGNIPIVNQARDLMFGYQFLKLPQPNEQTISNTLYLRGEFGTHREELYAKKMASRLDVAPNDLYNKALSLYNAAKYWDGYFLFSQILNDYPDFFKNDWVSYYAGACQENLDMRDAALTTLFKMKAEFPQSNALNAANLSVMRIHYRMERYSTIPQDFGALTGQLVSDSIKNSGAFIFGQTEMMQKSYAKAVNFFTAIPSTHPDYLFAQHSAAIANLAMNKAQDAADNFENCIVNPPTTPAQKDIVYRSYLYLGYMLYENILNEDRALSKAVSLLKTIPKESGYYKEAQVVLGWAAIKAHQGADCIAAGQALLNDNNSIFFFEGSLITAYGYMKMNKFNEAKEILVAANDKISLLKPMSNDTLSIEKQVYSDRRNSYDSLAQKMVLCAQQQQIGPILQENNSLHSQQKATKSKIDASLLFFDTFHKVSFLTRSADKLKEDLTYMLAVVSKSTVDKASQKEYNKMLEKQKNIDKEIEKLKGQLEKEDKK